MTVIELQFPAGGRLHATPWGRHVNEGATEWPVSPWRLQRALVATWYLKARDEISGEDMAALMESLAGRTPVFELPPAVQSHTRHYMPGRGTDKPKVFDTFVQASQPLRIAWEVTLGESQRRALSLLCERLGYLGRAESIVEAVLLPFGSEVNANSTPLAADGDAPPGCELVRVLCPAAPADYATWLAANQPAADPAAKGKKTKGKAAAITPPATVFEALHAETATLQAQGWLIPPGSRWVDYHRSSGCFMPEPRRHGRRSDRKVTVARFAISSKVLPRITQAVSVADRLHKRLVSKADKLEGWDAGVFTGLGADGLPLEDHRHTHLFCEPGDQRDSIGYITLYAPDGFGIKARQVIEEVQSFPLWGEGGHGIEVILLGFGDEGTFDSPLFGSSRTWRSLTPFVSTQHLKTYRDGRPKLDEASGWQKGSAAHSLLHLLETDPRTAGKMKPGTLRRLDVIRISPQRKLRCLQFQTIRHHGHGQRGNGDSGAFTLEFTEPVRGPLAFGYGSHFGLGLFVPAPAPGQAD